jgi:hypothetical protein
MKYIVGILFLLLSFESYLLLKVFDENKTLKKIQESSDQLISGMAGIHSKIYLKISEEIANDSELAIKISKEAACGQFFAIKKMASNKESSAYTKERYLEIKSDFELICGDA